MRRGPAALVVIGAFTFAAACLELPDRTSHDIAPGAEAITVRAEDDRPLDARLWARDSSRLVIYLHEYQRTQRDWWTEAARGGPAEPSALTVDLRGHGDSGGDHQDFELMPGDIRRVIEYARGRGFQRITLVGAGLGATVGVIVARDDPSITVTGLSLAADFAGLDALEAAKASASRLTVVASRDDLSARESLEQVIRAARLDPTRAVLLSGRAHGRALLTGDSEAVTRRMMREAAERAWRQTGSPATTTPSRRRDRLGDRQGRRPAARSRSRR